MAEEKPRAVQFSLLPLHYDLETVFTVATFSFACLWISTPPPYPSLSRLLLAFCMFSPRSPFSLGQLFLSRCRRSLFLLLLWSTALRSAQEPFTGNNESNTPCTLLQNKTTDTKQKREGRSQMTQGEKSPTARHGESSQASFTLTPPASPSLCSNSNG